MESNNQAKNSYILQMKAFIADSSTPVYSCSLLQVTGGFPIMNQENDCISDNLITPTCISESTSGASAILEGAKGGNFCYKRDGAGNVDQKINKPPVNIACDPRVGCDQIAVAPFLCAADITTQILSPTVSPHASCPGTATETHAPYRSHKSRKPIITTSAVVGDPQNGFLGDAEATPCPDETMAPTFEPTTTVEVMTSTEEYAAEATTIDVADANLGMELPSATIDDCATESTDMALPTADANLGLETAIETSLTSTSCEDGETSATVDVVDANLGLETETATADCEANPTPEATVDANLGIDSASTATPDCETKQAVQANLGLETETIEIPTPTIAVPDCEDTDSPLPSAEPIVAENATTESDPSFTEDITIAAPTDIALPDSSSEGASASTTTMDSAAEATTIDVIAEAIPTDVTTADATPTPSLLPLCGSLLANNAIPDGTSCDVITSPVICSLTQVAQCASILILT
jgi:hypothetical protein